MAEFIALPVGQGDAFYLQTGPMRVLVDGGKSERALPALLLQEAHVPALDVVICTHNDADHANGIVGLLEERPFPIREVWLPGTWCMRLDAFADAAGTIRELAKDLHEAGWPALDDREQTEALARRAREEGAASPGDADAERELEAWNDVSSEFCDELSRRGLAAFAWHATWEVVLADDDGRKAYVLAQWLGLAERIARIFAATADAGVCVRFFEFVKDASLVAGGLRGLLEPVNSREGTPGRSKVSLLAWLALTQANRESLVFHACEREDEPGVLFTADSDLACGLAHVSAPCGDVVVTAPHHGSEENASAYGHVVSWARGRVLWVRSDCRSTRRPGPTFKRQRFRYCTLCNPPQGPKTAVRLEGRNGRWWSVPGTTPCTC